MLYNPQWEKNHLMRIFIGWLKTKRADEQYDWHDIPNCACGQFWQHIGYDFANALSNRERVMLQELALGDGRGDWTFGRLLARAEMALAEVSA